MAAIVQSSQVPHPVLRLRDGIWTDVEDTLATEEPLEIRLQWRDGQHVGRRSISITMRTPGHDFELAAGFLFGESILTDPSDVHEIDYCRDGESDADECNTVLVSLRPGLVPDLRRLERNFFTTSSCGVCGKASLGALEVQGCSLIKYGFTVPAETIRTMPAALREAQSVFDQTGGLHGCGLFTRDGRLLATREDVGRHNALDKLIGAHYLAADLPLEDRVLLLSGRASFELLQKALIARIPVVAAVGAPSSLAVSLAQAFNITLVGFVRPGSMNVYTGRERILA